MTQDVTVVSDDNIVTLTYNDNQLSFSISLVDDLIELLEGLTGDGDNEGNNPHARHQEIIDAAITVVDDSKLLPGGVEQYDALLGWEQKRVLRKMANVVEEQADCSIKTARSNIRKVLKARRHALGQS